VWCQDWWDRLLGLAGLEVAEIHGSAFLLVVSGVGMEVEIILLEVTSLWDMIYDQYINTI
jgi:hypothetical protein